MNSKFILNILLTNIWVLISPISLAKALENKNDIIVGTFYFGGWQRSPNYHLDQPRSLLLTPPFEKRKPKSGWFDDRQEVVDQEISWAVRGKIDFFVFLWYWPKVLTLEEDKLNYPLDLYQKSNSKNKKFVKFCILYVNHGDFDIPPGEEWDRYTTLWINWMARRDYLNVSVQKNSSPKPLLLIFSPRRFHEGRGKTPGGTKSALDNLRAKAIRHGLPGIYIGGCWDPTVSAIMNEDGYDIVTGYNFYWAGGSKIGNSGKYNSLIMGHRSAWDSMATLDMAVIPTITSGWDPRAWPDALKNSPFYPDRSPRKFKEFCKSGKKWLNAHNDKLVVPNAILIYAWNELGEGGYILPTVGDGFAHLDAIRNVFGETTPNIVKRTLR